MPLDKDPKENEKDKQVKKDFKQQGKNKLQKKYDEAVEKA